MKRILLFLFFVAVVAGGLYGYFTYYAPSQTASEAEPPLVASGVIEAETTLITSETGGRVVAVRAHEGDEVQAGDLLVQMDDSDLSAQEINLEAAVATARANLAAAKQGPQAETVAVAETELAQAKVGRDGAYEIWQEMERVAADPQELLIPIREMEAQVTQAEGQVKLAKVALKAATVREEDAARDQGSGPGKVAYQVAQLGHQAADLGVEIAEANLQALRVQLAYLREQYNNPLEAQVQARQAEWAYRVAEAQVQMAGANLSAAQAGPRDGDIAVAEAQVAVAESARAPLDVAAHRLDLVAPGDGQITTRSADPGEVVAPGAVLLTLADLDTVTLRVFIPETQIGKLALGESARVTIDSVDQPFEGEISYIADEAEFTPANVQTAAERVNLVFAVEITLSNPEHILKPGMPADAEF